MSEQIKEIWQRAYRNHYEDGMVEIGMGVMFVVIGLGEMVVDIAINEGKLLWIILDTIGMMLVVMAGTVLMKKIVSRLKTSITYPRTGYVEIRQESKRGSATLMAFSLVLAISLLFGAWYEIEWINNMGFVVGILMTAIIVQLGYRTYTQRFYWVAGLPFIAAFVLPGLRVPDVTASAIVFGLLGLGLLFSGTYAMNQFVEQNPILADEEA